MGVHCHVLEYSRAKVVNGVIEGVKIIGTKSRNGRVYPQAVLNQAMDLYEGQQVYMLHPTAREKRQGSRQLADHFGTLMDVREIPGKSGMFCDLHTKQCHPMAGLIMENAEGSTFGLSHNAVVEFGDDGTTVTKIVRVNSVDLVDQPATTHNLFEEDDMPSLEEISELLGKSKGEILSEVAKIIDERIGVLESKQTPPAEKPKPTKRISALETVTEGDDGDPAPIGKSHDDFLNCVRGFSNTTRGA